MAAAAPARQLRELAGAWQVNAGHGSSSRADGI